MNTKILAAAFLLAAGSASTAVAGPFIIAGTDADEHGSATATANLQGWLFMQKSLEAIAPGVTNGNKKVVVLGSSGSSAGAAAASSFGKSSLPGSGWNSVNIDGVAAINNFFAGVGADNINNAGILMMDSSANNVGGGADNAELAAFTAAAAVINSFLGSGGGLFSQSNGFGWISALLPTLTVVNGQRDGLALTAAGNTAFPSLTNADLSAGPWHNYFSNTGAIPILAVSTDASLPGVPVILGASGGSVTNPTVPDGGSAIVLMFTSMCSLFAGLKVLNKRSAVK